MRVWIGILLLILSGCVSYPRAQPWNFPKAEEWNKPLEFSWVNAVDNWRNMTGSNKKSSTFVTPEREKKPDDVVKILDVDLPDTEEHHLYP